MRKVSELDKANLKKIRTNVSKFIAKYGKKYDKKDLLLLDIAPQDHEGAKPYFQKATIKTLDIDPKSTATYIADICQTNDKVLPESSFDIVVCTEVLEHTVQPFEAVKEIKRVLKPGGVALVSTPFNFRIHGPLPDCWRFTEHGLRELFSEFEIIDLSSLEEEGRYLMPIHYTLVVRKNSK